MLGNLTFGNNYGVILYLLAFGKVPFSVQHGPPSVFRSIREDDIEIPKEGHQFGPHELNKDFFHLLRCLMEEDPVQRISLPEVLVYLHWIQCCVLGGLHVAVNQLPVARPTTVDRVPRLNENTAGALQCGAVYSMATVPPWAAYNSSVNRVLPLVDIHKMPSPRLAFESSKSLGRRAIIQAV